MSATHFPPTVVAPGGHRRGFTLTEVLISIALVLVIILGVNQVFALTSRAVSSGQALSATIRAARDIQPVITSDLRNAEIDRAPWFLIKSTSVSAFRNSADRQADNDYVPTESNLNALDQAVRTLDRDANGSDADAADLTPRTALTSRTHRADFLGFFVRAAGRKQSGNGNTFSTDLTSNEQYVVYTHLRQPTFLGTLNPDLDEGVDPGPINHDFTSNTDVAISATNNPTNFYATQWILGRKAMLLREPDVTTGRIYDNTRPTAQQLWYYNRNASPTNYQLDPFQRNSTATNDGTTAGTAVVQNSNFDLMGLSIQNFRSSYMANIIANNSTPTPGVWQDVLTYRPTGSNTPIRPLTAAGVARTVPCFLPNCTQFAVEFAGDFVNQNSNTGAVVHYAGETSVPATDQTDGQIDFCLDTTTGKRTVRWYGYPRDTDGNGHIFGTSAKAMAPIVSGGGNMPGGLIQQTDTIPLRDFVRTYAAGFAGFTFERDVGNKIGGASTPIDDYAVEGALNRAASYVCCWSTDSASLPRPKMIRITVGVDDPAGRIGDQQIYQYVVGLP